MARQLVVHMLLLLTGVRYYPVITSLRHTVTPDQWYQPLTSKDVNGRTTVHMAIEMHNWLQLQFLSRSVSKDHWKNLLHIRENGGRTPLQTAALQMKNVSFKGIKWCNVIYCLLFPLDPSDRIKLLTMRDNRQRTALNIVASGCKKFLQEIRKYVPLDAWIKILLGLFEEHKREYYLHVWWEQSKCHWVVNIPTMRICDMTPERIVAEELF